MKNKLKLAAAALLVMTTIIALSGCGSSGQSAVAQDNKLKVVASFYPMYEFTRQVAGDLADITTLIPSGVEPHDWEPTPQDVKNIEQSDLFVYNGAGMESWVDQVLGSLNGHKGVVVEASRGLDLLTGFKEEDEEDHGTDEKHDHEESGGTDPHVWLSPALAIKEVRAIEAGLSQADPAHKDVFKQNADTYVAKLEQLDNDFRDSLKEVKRKDFITQHAAFGYLAREYGLTQVPIAGLSPEQEPSAEKMAEIVKFAKAHNVKTIFFETLVTSKVADAVANEIGAKSAVLNPIEGLTDEDRKNNLDYIGIMRQNLNALKQALGE